MPCGHWQIEQYVLSVMVQLVRLAAGPDWIPERAYLQSDSAAGVEQGGFLGGTRLHLAQNCTAIEIPRCLLPMAITTPANSVATEPLSDELPIEQRFSNNLLPLIESMLGNVPTTINQLADHLAIHPRSIQRLLAHEGKTFSQLLEQARLDRATNYLNNTDISITKLALELGYSDAAHFSRAFKRWQGQTPRSFRIDSQTGRH